jgi:hypothetical protein
MSFRKTRLHPIVVLVAWVSLSGLILDREAQSPDAPRFDSPRMAALARELMAGHRDALDEFWRQMKGSAPLVEPIPGSDADVQQSCRARCRPGTSGEVWVLACPRFRAC